MGLKKGRCIFSEDSLVCSTLNSLRTAIIRRLGADASYHPVVTVDASSWIIAALNNPAHDSKVSAQFHAQPPVPVTAVSEYIKKRCDLLKKHKFIPIIVLDGQRFPLKSEENSARQEGSNIEDHFMELYEAYCLSDDHPRDDVFCLRKKTMWPREDVYHDVVNSLQRDGIFAVCAPFEADHQILALQNQGIADAAIAVDTDLPGLGVNYTIKKLTLNGGAYYMCQSKLMNEVLPGRFIEGWNARAQAGPVESPVMSDARNLFCCMLGVDYLRDGLPGSGPVIRNCFSCLSFDELDRCMPVSIHSVAKQCHLVHHLYPGPCSREYGIKRNIKDSVKEARTSSDDEESDVDDLRLEVMNEIEGQGEVVSGSNEEGRRVAVPKIDLCETIETWCDEIELSMDQIEASHLADPRLSQKACEKAAKPITDPRYWERFNIRAKREKDAVDKGLSPATMHGHYCDNYIRNQLQENDDEQRNLEDCIQYPDHIVYPTGIEDESDSENDFDIM